MASNVSLVNSSNNSFILDNYDVAFKSSQVTDLSEARVFVLGEMHEYEVECRQNQISRISKLINSGLILKCIEDKSLLFLEGNRAMEDVESESSLISKLELSLQVLESKEIQAVKEIPHEILAKALKVLNDEDLKSKYNIDRFAYSQIVKIFGWDVSPDFEVSDGVIEKAKKNGYNFAERKYAVIWGKLKNDWVKLQNEILSSQLTDLEKNKRTIKIYQIGKIQEMMMDETMLERNKSLLNTIKQIKNLSLYQGKAFLIAGALHVQEDKKMGEAYRLGALYEELENCKGVALVPKILSEDMEKNL
jgi:hypothetical protein